MTTIPAAASFAAAFIALYVAHLVGDHWVQTDHQAAHKGCDPHHGGTAHPHCTRWRSRALCDPTRPTRGAPDPAPRGPGRRADHPMRFPRAPWDDL
jgi:hypothetical protein